MSLLKTGAISILLQYPVSRTFHFYSEMDRVLTKKEMLQCPVSWAFHFYLVEGIDATDNGLLQCPVSWAFHFYGTL